MPRSVVLASSSPRRHALLRELMGELIRHGTVSFEVCPVDVDETPPAGATPSETARALAEAKARAAPRGQGAVVVGADTVVVAPDGEILGKPADAEHARQILRRLSGTTHSVITGVCVVGGAPGRTATASVETRVTMREMSEDEIDRYVASGEPFGKAGAYAIQETGDQYVTSVDGSWSNVVGLPLERLREMLQDAGVPVESVA